MMKISFVVARDEQYGIGKENNLLCHLPADLKYFKALTTGHCILMGRRTFESIGRPLPGRTNMVITRDKNARIEGCEVFNTADEAIAFARSKNETELFVIGGGMIFRDLFNLADKLYVTLIHHSFHADTFFPVPNPEDWELVRSEAHHADEKNSYDYTFEVYTRRILM